MKLHLLASSGVALGALALAPTLAAAQPSSAPPGGNPSYYGQQPQNPGGFHLRQNRMAVGVSLGLGGMSTDEGDVDCGTCDYEPIAVEFDFHIGGMLSPRLALLLELQGNAQTIAEVGGGEGSITLVQGAAMAAAQYWVLPQLWLKGGVGFANTSLTYSDYYGDESEPVDRGAAFMAAVGYEVFSARTFSVDLQLRGIVGVYGDSGDADDEGESLTSGSFGIGLNWY